MYQPCEIRYFSLRLKVRTRVPKRLQIVWAVGFEVGDYVKELNAVYRATENIRIPIVMAIDYCTLKLRRNS